MDLMVEAKDLKLPNLKRICQQMKKLVTREDNPTVREHTKLNFYRILDTYRNYFLNVNKIVSRELKKGREIAITGEEIAAVIEG